MGDLQVCSGLPNGVVDEDRPFAMSLSSLPLRAPNSDPSSIGEDSWAIAEQTTQEVICCIHPTLDSEEKRKDVIEYVQRLIRCSIGCEVFPYGSVPLKTYLPDGDIDLTALSNPTIEETLAHDVLAVLQGEEHNEKAEYEVKDTQFIDAEVKLVKCLVQNIVIDISFNQLGGLCTLCFLEQVDRLVGKDHLFKRSIILIKAWCYYESRILGAHHGLISTYALETLILYIFHLFHSSLNGPLAVLYRFLDYFSKFDWENYCISLKGPVIKSSLPDMVVEMPTNVGDNLMLSEEFLRNCMDMFSIPSRVPETNLRTFPQKYLNIIDPLKENNNLGRSVHRGNFYRIRSAFKYGARKLGQILLLPRERIADEIKKFFSNTLERHGRKSGNLSSSAHSRTSSEEKIQLNLLNLGLDNSVPGVGDNKVDGYSLKADSFQATSEMVPTDGMGISGSHRGGEASLRIASDTSDYSPSSCELSNPLSGLYLYAPYYYASGSSAENDKFENKMLCEELLDERIGIDSWVVDEKIGFNSWMEHTDNHVGGRNGVCSCSTTNNHEGLSSSGSGISSPDATASEGLALDFREKDLADIAGSPEALNPLSELSGDYDGHIRSLLYGQCCHGYALSAPVLPNTMSSFPFQFQNKKPLDTPTVRQSTPIESNAHSQMSTNGIVSEPTHNPRNANFQMNPNGVVSEPAHNPRNAHSQVNPNGVVSEPSSNPRNSYSQMNPIGVVSGSTHNLVGNHKPSNSLGLEEKHKQIRGTGTYFPTSNGCSCRERSSQGGRGRNHRQFRRYTRNNGSPAPALPEKKSFEEGSHELPRGRTPVPCDGRSGLDCQSTHSASDDSDAAGFSVSTLKLQFGSLGYLSEECSKLASETSVALKMPGSKKILANSQERVGRHSFNLRNEDEFPPLKL